jgi:hypothetical protein
MVVEAGQSTNITRQEDGSNNNELGNNVAVVFASVNVGTIVPRALLKLLWRLAMMEEG